GKAILTGGDPNLIYDISGNYNLSKGDEITINVYTNEWSSNVESFIEEVGYVPEELSRTYTVDEFCTYVNDIADVPKDTLEDLQEAAVTYLSQKSENWADELSIKDTEYQGAYLYSRKEASDYSAQNKIYLVYKVTIEADYSSYNHKEDIVSYYIVEFENVAKNSDGDVFADTSSATLGYAYSSVKLNLDSKTTKTLYFDGYESMDKVKSEYGTNSSYNITTTVK
nr:hypothetical protein [Parasporobacterium sp.]